MAFDVVVSESRRQSAMRIERFRQYEPQSLGAGNVALGSSNILNQFDQFEQSRYRKNRGWPYAAIAVKARTIAGQPVYVGRVPRKRTGRRSVKGLPQGIEPIESHWLLDVFDNPNELMTRWQLLYVTVASFDLVGQAYWWLSSENGTRTLWPIPASWIRPNHDIGPWKQWDITPGGSGEEITRPASEILYFYHPDPIRPDATTSPTDAMSDSIEADESMELSKRVSFDNAVWPGMALIVGSEEGQEGESSTRPEIGWEQKRVMIDRIKQYYAGVVNKDEPLILDAVIQDVKMLTRGPRELDFMQSGKSTKERITQAYGVNPIVMGQIEGVNRASAVEARRLLADFAINPIIELLNATMAKRLTPMMSRGGIKTYVWIEPYRPDDADQTRADWVAAQRARAVTRNEWRTEILGLPARDGWDDVVLTGSEIPIPAGMTNKQAEAVLRNASMVSE